MEPTRRVIQLQAAAAWAVTVVAALAAAGFVGQAIGRQAGRDLADRRVLAALGMTRRDVVLAGVIRMVPVAAAAGVIAAVTAVLASPLGPIGVARKLEIDPGIRVDAWLIAIGLLVVVFFALGVTAASAYLAVARRARAAVRPFVVAPRSLPVSGAAGLSFLRRREQGSLTNAVVGTALALTVVVFAIGMAASHDALDGHPERFGQNWKIVLGDFGSAEETAAGKEQISGVDGIGGMAQTRSTEASAGDVPVFVFSFIDPDDAVGPTVLDGRQPRNGKEIALGTTTMDALDVSIGDDVTLRSPISGDPVGPLRVVGQIVANDGVDGEQPPGSGGLLTTEAFDRIDSASTGQSLLIEPAPGVSTATLLDRLQSAFGGTVIRAVPPEDVANLDRVAIAPAILAGVVGVLAVSAMVNALLTLLARRRREVAILRSIGFTRAQVLGASCTTAFVLAAGASALGVPLGIIATRWGWAVVQTRLGVESGVVQPIGWILVAIAATFGGAVAVSLIPGVRASRVAAAEALRSE